MMEGGPQTLVSVRPGRGQEEPSEAEAPGSEEEEPGVEAEEEAEEEAAGADANREMKKRKERSGGSARGEKGAD